jgi:peptidoglycan-N-acetylglucosamine deacetylase
MARVLPYALFAASALAAACAPKGPGGGDVVAITMDDLPFAGTYTEAEAEEATRRILASLAEEHIHATAFVIGHRVGSHGDAARDMALLREWRLAGHDLGNHTFSHDSLDDDTLAQYVDDTRRCEALLEPLLRGTGQRGRYFRYPYLQLGTDRERKDGFIAFARREGMTRVPVTMDNDDYNFAAVYSAAVQEKDELLAERVRDAYLTYLDENIAYYGAVSKELFARNIPQIFISHASLLNADTFPRVFALFKRRGYRFAPVDEVMRDPAYATADTYLGKDGESWLYRWRHSQGKTSALEEPEAPEWIYDKEKDL